MCCPTYHSYKGQRRVFDIPCVLPHARKPAVRRSDPLLNLWNEWHTEVVTGPKYDIIDAVKIGAVREMYASRLGVQTDNLLPECNVRVDEGLPSKCRDGVSTDRRIYRMLGNFQDLVNDLV
jgi:hypothetical protein